MLHEKQYENDDYDNNNSRSTKNAVKNITKISACFVFVFNAIQSIELSPWMLN